MPIGIVKSNIKKPGKANWQTTVSKIIINEDLNAALDHIEEFSHIIVVYWMHQVTSAQRSVIKVHPRGKQHLPLVGVLTTRSPARPNPIGITTVELVERQGNVLNVAGLDAIDGAPVIDIKPYIPGYDSPPRAETPDWIESNSRLPMLSEEQP